MNLLLLTCTSPVLVSNLGFWVNLGAIFKSDYIVFILIVYSQHLNVKQILFRSAKENQVDRKLIGSIRKSFNRKLKKLRHYLQFLMRSVLTIYMIFKTISSTLSILIG